MNSKLTATLYILIQIGWVALAVILGFIISKAIFNTILLRSIFGGLFTVIIYLAMWWISEAIKAGKDPDVQESSKLHMSVSNFRRYKQIWERYQEFIALRDTQPTEADDAFKDVFSQIRNLEEWRRFGEYMEEKIRKERSENYTNVSTYWHNQYEIGATIPLYMDDGRVCLGVITDVLFSQRLYEVMFDEEVSLVPVKEPEGGWVDNAWPKKILKVSEKEIREIFARTLEGTTVHFHY